MSNDVLLELVGIEVKLSNPDKIFFPGLGKTKLDVVNYYRPWPPARCSAFATGR